MGATIQLIGLYGGRIHYQRENNLPTAKKYLLGKDKPTARVLYY